MNHEARRYSREYRRITSRVFFAVSLVAIAVLWFPQLVCAEDNSLNKKLEAGVKVPVSDVSSELQKEFKVEPSPLDPLSLSRILKTLFALAAVCSLAVILLTAYARRYHGNQFKLFVRDKHGDKSKEGLLRVVHQIVIDRESRLVEVETDLGERLLFSVGRNGLVYQGKFDVKGFFLTRNIQDGVPEAVAEVLTEKPSAQKVED